MPKKIKVYPIIMPEEKYFQNRNIIFEYNNLQRFSMKFRTDLQFFAYSTDLGWI